MTKQTVKESKQMTNQVEMFTPTEMTKPEPATLPVISRKPTGLGSMPTSNLIIPQLKLLQGISPELNEYDHLKRGTFFHSINKVGLEQPLRFVPVFIRQRIVIFRPEQDGRGVIATSSDGVHWDQPNATFKARFVKDKWVEFKISGLANKSPLLKFGSSDPSDPSSKPIATRLVELIVILPDHPELGACVFTFKRSSLKVGDELHTSFMLEPGEGDDHAPIYKFVYKMKWRAVEQDKKQYLVPVPLRDGKCEGILSKLAEKQCAIFTKMAEENTLVVDEDLDDETSEITNTKRSF